MYAYCSRLSVPAEVRPRLRNWSECGFRSEAEARPLPGAPRWVGANVSADPSDSQLKSSLRATSVRSRPTRLGVN